VEPQLGQAAKRDRHRFECQIGPFPVDQGPEDDDLWRVGRRPVELGKPVDVDPWGEDVKTGRQRRR
jgi:hypothetical protein